MVLDFETVTKKDLIAKGYSEYRSIGIIREAKALLVQQGCHYYRNSRIGRVPAEAVEAVLRPQLQGQVKEL